MIPKQSIHALQILLNSGNNFVNLSENTRNSKLSMFPGLLSFTLLDHLLYPCVFTHYSDMTKSYAVFISNSNSAHHPVRLVQSPMNRVVLLICLLPPIHKLQTRLLASSIPVAQLTLPTTLTTGKCHPVLATPILLGQWLMWMVTFLVIATVLTQWGQSAQPGSHAFRSP